MKPLHDQLRDAQAAAEAALEQTHADQRRKIKQAANMTALAIDFAASWLDTRTQQAATRVRAAIATARSRGFRPR